MVGAIKEWSGYGEASAKVFDAEKTMFPRAPSLINGNQTKPLYVRERAISMLRYASVCENGLMKPDSLILFDLIVSWLRGGLRIPRDASV